MILVMEAGYQGCVALSAASTLAVSASTRIRASALTGDPDRVMAAHAAAKAKPNVDGREIIRFAVRSLLVVQECGGCPRNRPQTPRSHGRRLLLYTKDQPKSKTSLGTSAPIPKFASCYRTSVCELRNQRCTSNLL